MSQQRDETSVEDEDSKYLEFADTVAMETTKDELWETISDPEALTMCVPGAESIERVSERKYTVDITRGVSKLTLSLSGEAEFVEMNPRSTSSRLQTPSTPRLGAISRSLRPWR